MKDNFEQNNLKGNKSPKLCYTSGGILIHENKVLLIKHKKLKNWLNPGGHIDEGELPHQAAEREFFEETGVRVKALDAMSLPTISQDFSLQEVNITGEKDNTDEQFMPNPLMTNLHWVNKESYDLRLKSDDPNKRFPTKTWKRGCEQHVGFFYILKPVDGVDFYQNEEETDGIAWFSLDEIDGIETFESVKDEIKLAFKFLGIK